MGKNSKKRNKNISYEESQYQELSQHWETGKEYDGAGLYLHKRKNGGAQWLYR
ncbi:hypothetical protein NMK50_09480 [Bartonella harrusi]|uniref:Phage integrase n=1 Tax=Bartonella harrusi TaxID=2961895 RepID=A0ABY5EWQ0_9HYPH|nr:hypothetical protein [Bartonella harrusi]UTO28343.1 hypothetical protein NMK50_09480 [Bartonella harrusi]